MTKNNNNNKRHHKITAKISLVSTREGSKSFILGIGEKSGGNGDIAFTNPYSLPLLKVSLSQTSVREGLQETALFYAGCEK